MTPSEYINSCLINYGEKEMDRNEYGLGCDTSPAFCIFWVTVIFVAVLIVYLLEGVAGQI